MKLVRIIISEVFAWIEVGLMSFPGRIGYRLRSLWLQNAFASSVGPISVGLYGKLLAPENMSAAGLVSMGDGCRLSAVDGKLKFGANVALNSGVTIAADMGEITIGNDVLIAMNVVMRAANHRFDRSPDVLIRKQGHDILPISIGNDVWIGAGAMILAGAKIGDHCVIGAGAVVTGEIPAGSVAVGAPAKVIRKVGPR